MLLYNKHAYITAKKLAKELEIVARNDRKRISTMPIIRYGSSKYFGFDNPQINDLGAITLASNKHISLGILNQEGITVPKIYLESTMGEMSYPVLARKVFHKQGRDINEYHIGKQAKQLEALRSCRDYFVEFIDAKAEYRLHCIDNEIVKIFRKVRLDEESHDFIRCARCGWGFYRVDTEQDWMEPMKNKAIESLRALGLYFGAVDMIHSTDHKFVVLEVNSAPALNTDTLSVYAEKIHCWLEANYERERVYRSKTYSFRVKDNIE